MCQDPSLPLTPQNSFLDRKWCCVGVSRIIVTAEFFLSEASISVWPVHSFVRKLAHCGRVWGLTAVWHQSLVAAVSLYKRPQKERFSHVISPNLSQLSVKCCGGESGFYHMILIQTRSTHIIFIFCWKPSRYFSVGESFCPYQACILLVLWCFCFPCFQILVQCLLHLYLSSSPCI